MNDGFIKHYIKKIFFQNATKIVLFIFDILGIVLLLIPSVTSFFNANFDLVRMLGLLIFSFSFILSNILEYKNIYERFYQFNDNFLVLSYFAEKYNYLKIENLSGFDLTEISATLHYINKGDNELNSIDGEFYKLATKSVWTEPSTISSFLNKDEVFLRLPNLSALESPEIEIEFSFTILKSSVRKTIKKTITSKPNDRNWLVS